MTISYNEESGAWEFSSVSDIFQNDAMNNMMDVGQPWSAYSENFDHEFRENLPENYVPTVEFSSADVIQNGFGRNITHRDFDIVKKLEGVSLPDGIYSSSQIVNLGLAKFDTHPDGIEFGDTAQGFSLYYESGAVGVKAAKEGGPTILDIVETAYVFGSVRFVLGIDTKFTFNGGVLVKVSGLITIQNDSFKHNTDALPAWVSAIAQILGGGENAHFEKVVITYSGNGVYRDTSFNTRSSDKQSGYGIGSSGGNERSDPSRPGNLHPDPLSNPSLRGSAINETRPGFSDPSPSGYAGKGILDEEGPAGSSSAAKAANDEAQRVYDAEQQRAYDAAQRYIAVTASGTGGGAVGNMVDYLSTQHFNRNQILSHTNPDGSVTHRNV